MEVPVIPHLCLTSSCKQKRDDHIIHYALHRRHTAAQHPHPRIWIPMDSRSPIISHTMKENREAPWGNQTIRNHGTLSRCRGISSHDLVADRWAPWFFFSIPKWTITKQISLCSKFELDRWAPLINALWLGSIAFRRRDLIRSARIL